MQRKYPHLSSPITIGRTVFRNRMFSAPMGGTDISNDGCIGPKSAAFYELRARGGAAAVTVSELMVHRQQTAPMLTIWMRASSIPLHRLPTQRMRSAAMELFRLWSFPIPVCSQELI